MNSLQDREKTGNIAWIFPGQGSQRIGMGIDLLKYSLARNRFEQARKILGWSVLEVCQNWQKLTLTLYTQPCIFVIHTLLIDLLKQTEEKYPDLVAGYSLGEYSALYASEVFDFEIGLKLIKQRAEIMNRAPKGTMVALVGFNQKQLESQLKTTSHVWRVNDSSRMAIVAGTIAGVKSLLSKIAFKRIIPLDVSTAFHTPLLEAATSEFLPILESTQFSYAKIPFLSSMELLPLVEPTRIKKNLIQQMTQPVTWEAISRTIANSGVTKIVEIGSEQNLTSQMKRVCSGIELVNISKIPTSSSFANTLI
ncbi:MAG: acyltransferase domain-containing protein [Xenococcaceae cyanobacterium]